MSDLTLRIGGPDESTRSDLTELIYTRTEACSFIREWALQKQPMTRSRTCKVTNKENEEDSLAAVVAKGTSSPMTSGEVEDDIDTIQRPRGLRLRDLNTAETPTAVPAESPQEKKRGRRSPGKGRGQRKPAGDDVDADRGEHSSTKRLKVGMGKKANNKSIEHCEVVSVSADNEGDSDNENTSGTDPASQISTLEAMAVMSMIVVQLKVELRLLGVPPGKMRGVRKAGLQEMLKAAIDERIAELKSKCATGEEEDKPSPSDVDAESKMGSPAHASTYRGSLLRFSSGKELLSAGTSSSSNTPGDAYETAAEEEDTMDDRGVQKLDFELANSGTKVDRTSQEPRVSAEEQLVKEDAVSSSAAVVNSTTTKKLECNLPFKTQIHDPTLASDTSSLTCTDEIETGLGRGVETQIVSESKSTTYSNMDEEEDARPSIKESHSREEEMDVEEGGDGRSNLGSDCDDEQNERLTIFMPPEQEMEEEVTSPTLNTKDSDDEDKGLRVKEAIVQEGEVKETEVAAKQNNINVAAHIHKGEERKKVKLSSSIVTAIEDDPNVQPKEISEEDPTEEGDTNQTRSIIAMAPGAASPPVNPLDSSKAASSMVALPGKAGTEVVTDKDKVALAPQQQQGMGVRNHSSSSHGSGSITGLGHSGAGSGHDGSGASAFKGNSSGGSLYERLTNLKRRSRPWLTGASQQAQAGQVEPVPGTGTEAEEGGVWATMTGPTATRMGARGTGSLVTVPQATSDLPGEGVIRASVGPSAAGAVVKATEGNLGGRGGGGIGSTVKKPANLVSSLHSFTSLVQQKGEDGGASSSQLQRGGGAATVAGGGHKVHIPALRKAEEARLAVERRAKERAAVQRERLANSSVLASGNTGSSAGELKSAGGSKALGASTMSTHMPRYGHGSVAAAAGGAPQALAPGTSANAVSSAGTAATATVGTSACVSTTASVSSGGSASGSGVKAVMALGGKAVVVMGSGATSLGVGGRRGSMTSSADMQQRIKEQRAAIASKRNARVAQIQAAKERKQEEVMMKQRRDDERIEAVRRAKHEAEARLKEQNAQRRLEAERRRGEIEQREKEREESKERNELEEKRKKVASVVFPPLLSMEKEVSNKPPKSIGNQHSASGGDSGSNGQVSTLTGELAAQEEHGSVRTGGVGNQAPLPLQQQVVNPAKVGGGNTGHDHSAKPTSVSSSSNWHHSKAVGPLAAAASTKALATVTAAATTKVKAGNEEETRAARGGGAEAGVGGIGGGGCVGGGAIAGTSSGAVVSGSKAPGSSVLVVPSSSEFNSYEMSDREGSSSDESDSEGESRQKRPKKRVPDWARGTPLRRALERQYSGIQLDPDSIFPEVLSCDLEAIFQANRKRYAKRGSSANWGPDRITPQEVLAYKRSVGINKNSRP